jgi:hypothetical protein
MAKKRATKKAVATPKVTTKVEGGMVTVSMGIKISANYNSESFDVGATLPIRPGESENEALERTRAIVTDFFSDNHGTTLDNLDGVIRDRKRGRG